MRSTFAGFTTARLALRASQKALDVTGQNIANINKDGYTRQRLDLVSLSVGSGTDRYKSEHSVHVGNGVLTSGLSQIRDPFLDIRFRNEIAHVGGQEQKQNILKDLENIFDEVSKKGIQEQVSDMMTMLQKLSGEVGNKEFDHMVKASAGVLTKMFNQYANQLEVAKNDQEFNLRKVEIPKLNDILKNIKNLNETIKANHIHGNPALELLDQRNSLIDELASYVNIDVKTDRQFLTNDPDGKFVEVLQIKIKHPQGDLWLIDDNKATQFKLQPDETLPPAPGIGFGDYKLEMTDIQAGNGTTINDVYGKLSSGAIRSSFDMLNKSGEFDANDPERIRGLGYYQKSLDLLANKIASSFNGINRYTRDDGVVVEMKLFDTNDGTADITAKNLKISDEWQKGQNHIIPSKSGKETGANDKILEMISLLGKKHDFSTQGGQRLFNGSFQEYFTNMGSVLGLDIKSTKAMMENHKTVAKEIANMRDSVSSVSLDEEGMSLLHYQKSYNAAARLMTTLDEAVATIINNMGVVGR
ncbi:MAG: flagellar basal body rod C-terminal domain-containing protein [Peptostreptococcaceae bacterium]|nr:flagellar basal body rod C-terminal domain-containing protein [Peptostreptococcaceae bacterium]